MHWPSLVLQSAWATVTCREKGWYTGSIAITWWCLVPDGHASEKRTIQKVNGHSNDDIAAAERSHQHTLIVSGGAAAMCVMWVILSRNKIMRKNSNAEHGRKSVDGKTNHNANSTIYLYQRRHPEAHNILGRRWLCRANAGCWLEMDGRSKTNKTIG